MKVTDIKEGDYFAFKYPPYIYVSKCFCITNESIEYETLYGSDGSNTQLGKYMTYFSQISDTVVFLRAYDHEVTMENVMRDFPEEFI